MTVLTFSDLLTLAHLDPTRVRLVRHQDTRHRTPTVFAVWKSAAGPDRVEAYQRIQRRDRFTVGDFLASFVVSPRPRSETVFIGMFRVDGIGTAPSGHKDPIFGNDTSGLNLYDIARLSELSEFVGRLVIEWGPGERSWVQRADRQRKPILAIRDPQDPPFPGFTRFSWNIDEVPGIYESWQEILRSVKGVYLLVDLDSGHQYVGSAKGEDSLFGRFMTYAEIGHGGNVELRARARSGPRRYRVSVLEVVDTRLPDERIEEIETAWKTKLMSREFGLNKN